MVTALVFAMGGAASAKLIAAAGANGTEYATYTAYPVPLAPTTFPPAPPLPPVPPTPGGLTHWADQLATTWREELLSQPCLGFHVFGQGIVNGAPISQGAYMDSECARLSSDVPPTELAISGTFVMYAPPPVVTTIRELTVDSIYGTYTATTAAPAPPALMVDPVGTFTITGGTGHYCGASGGGSLIAVASVATGLANAVYDLTTWGGANSGGTCTLTLPAVPPVP
ncbi:MAG: hypothetical protein ACYC9D_04090 [Candidatus Dormibacteria bacterium]